jgi:hypothetical protein
MTATSSEVAAAIRPFWAGFNNHSVESAALATDTTAARAPIASDHARRHAMGLLPDGRSHPDVAEHTALPGD